MCGIAGIYAFRASAPSVEREELRAVRDHMARRGPDGSGEWFSADGRVGLGHRRLAIIDLSERGAQPMASADGSVVVSFNGEIYNHRELRRELESRGRAFRSDSDTEVLLHLYELEGEAMLTRLRGMFALALWDGRKRSMLLARDAFGIKPLYYSSDGGTLRFASLVKALLRPGTPIDTAPDPAGHVGFFLWGSVPSPWTLYRGIRAVPAGHALWIGPEQAGPPHPFCEVTSILAEAAANPARGTRDDALAAISAAVRDSIAAHHVSDVPVAVFLSAGLDSALIAALSANLGRPPRTMTLGFAEYAGTAHDEVPAAEALARSLGTDHATVAVRKEDFHAEEARLMEAMDQPSIDGINAWFVARAARSVGVKVALSGLGGDELFASYPSFRQVPRLRSFTRPFAVVPALGKALRRAASPLLKRLTSPKHASLLEYGPTLGGAYLLRRGLHMPWEIESLLEPAFVREGLQSLEWERNLQHTTRGIASDRLAVSALEMSWYTRHQLLADTDWASMAHSLEVRVPFLDVPLLRAAAPWLAAHPGITKPEVARAIAPSLGQPVLERHKSGFSVPVREWVAGSESVPARRGLRGWAEYVHRASAPRHVERVRRSAEGSLALWSPTMATPGGVQSYMWRLWEVLMGVCGSASAPRGVCLQDEPEQLARWDNPSPARPAGAAGHKWRFVRYALGRQGRARVVIVGHVNQAPVAWIAWRLSLIRQYIVILHGIEAWRRLTPLRRLAVRDAHAVVATTSYSAVACARANALSGHNFRIVPLCAEPVPAAPDPRFALDGAFRILFVARLSRVERYKGLETLTAAVSLLVRERGIPAKLHVVGDGDDMARLQEVARDHGLTSDSVHFHGRLSDAQLQAAYASAHVFSMPSEKEGFGIVFLEAMRRGVACIGGAHGGTPEVFEDGREGMLVPHGDCELLAQRLEALATDDALRERLARAGQARFERSYTFPIFQQRWAELLERHAQA
ncbi:asparagine synthase (glutamine-hydrolyzing) [Ramlibacter sp. PS4R-6]|uniref:asparagine synthase (glutamine-hydrolyzing) n=1 Tax=Ramlibacter sp. PS4R-6 TaxID=3133438 RepID=UPI0030B6A4F0